MKYGYPLISGVIQHEAGDTDSGNWVTSIFITTSSLILSLYLLRPEAFNWAKSLGWYETFLPGRCTKCLGLILFDDRYSDVVDIYEGGFKHAMGISSRTEQLYEWYIPYHSAGSREAIVKRIMLTPEKRSILDEFVKNDKGSIIYHIPPGTWTGTARGNQYPPVIHKGRPSI